MKKKISALFVIMAIIFCFALTVFADGERLRDDAGLLAEQEQIEIRDSLDAVSNELGVDIVIHTTDTFQGKNAQNYADDFYDQSGYGADGVMFVLNMTDREGYITTAGEGIEAFTDYGIEQCNQSLVPYLQEGDIKGAFEKFISVARQYFQEERNGDPIDSYDYDYDYDYDPEPFSSSRTISTKDILIRVLFGFVIAFLISLIITAGMKKKMKSVAAQRNANVYVKGDNINITKSKDRYLYNHIVATPIPHDDDHRSGGHSGGSSVHISSSGRSHGGGGFKF